MARFIALELAASLYKECEELNLKNPIKDQLLRASLSIALNLGEGSGRRSLKDQKRFYFIALGSTREAQVLVKIINHKELIKKYDRLGALVYGLSHKSDRLSSEKLKDNLI